MRNEKGSTLIQVLLIVLIFSVLGVTLIGNVIGENKRINKTESNTHARNLARDGLTYFEADFKNMVEGKNAINLSGFLQKYKPNEEFPDKGGYVIESGEVKILVTAKLVDLQIKSSDSNNKKIDSFKMKVVSKGIEPIETEPLTGYYKIDFDIDFEKAKNRLASFSPDAIELDVSNSVIKLNLSDLTGLNVLGIQDLGLLKNTTVELLKIPGNDDGFYPIPDDRLVGGILNLNINMNKNNHNSFQKVRDNEAIAVRGELLASIDLANLAKLNLLNQPSEKLTNVVINGEYSNLLEIPLLGDPLNGLVNGILSGVVKVVGGVVGELLNTLKNLLDGVFKTLECILTGKNCPDKNKSKEKEKETVGKIITELNDLLQDNLEAITPTDNPYDDIEFKKFAVLGEALIEQHSLDSDDKRNFTFKNGLYVGKTLNIGGFINDLPLSQANYSKLFLDGDSDKDQNGGMFTAAGLNINNAEIDFNSDVYAYNTAFTPKSTIKNACIKQSDNHYFRLLTNGKLDIYRNKECSTLEGLFFSSNVNHPVTIYATEDMTIDGGIVGAVNVEGNGVVTIKYDAAYLDTLEVKEAKLVPVGRTYE